MHRALSVALCALLFAPAARGYNEELHAVLTTRALAAHQGWRTQSLKPPTSADLDSLRALFWRTAAALPDARLREKWLRRFPTEASLDAWAFKEFLMLDPAATVHGLDLTKDDAQPRLRFELLSLASRWPDDDERNRRRYFRDAKREPVKQPDGSPTPYDPMTLALGGLSGGTSQGHAHYGLLDTPYSDDPEVLKSDPRHFAIPHDIKAFGQEFAQLYADLALFAEGAGLPSSRWLSVVHAGASFHHLEDVANQIHTVQVGTYEFFKSAYLQSKLRDLQTAGGLFGARRSLPEIGLRLVANHHLFLEDLFAKRVVEAAAGRPVPLEVKAAVEGISRDAQPDPTASGASRKGLEQAVGLAAPANAPSAPEEGPFARVLAERLIEDSSHEGPEVYRLAWGLSAQSLREGSGHEYKSPPDDPDLWIAPPSAERDARLREFWLLEGRGLTRAGTVLRVWQELHDKAAARATALRTPVVARMLALLLPYHQAAAERRAAYAPSKEVSGIAWGYPIAYALILIAIASGVRKIVKKRRSRQA